MLYFIFVNMRKNDLRPLSRYRDLTNMRFGKLVAIKPFKLGSYLYWKCICDCGNFKEALSSNIQKGSVRTCGYCRPDDKSRFLEKVEKTDSCWIWKGKTNKQRRYGRFMMDKKPNMTAHRASYILFKGPIPKGIFVCHTCDNPICVNPEHLFLGSAKDNIRDALSKGRMKGPVGELNKGLGRKLSENDVLRIRKIKKEGYPSWKILEEYQISRALLSLIINRKLWKHLKE